MRKLLSILLTTSILSLLYSCELFYKIHEYISIISFSLFALVLLVYISRSTYVGYKLDKMNHSKNRQQKRRK
jgi:hypothetical protein